MAVTDERRLIQFIIGIMDLITFDVLGMSLVKMAHSIILTGGSSIPTARISGQGISREVSQM